MFWNVSKANYGTTFLPGGLEIGNFHCERNAEGDTDELKACILRFDPPPWPKSWMKPPCKKDGWKTIWMPWDGNISTFVGCMIMIWESSCQRKKSHVCLSAGSWIHHNISISISNLGSVARSPSRPYPVEQVPVLNFFVQVLFVLNGEKPWPVGLSTAFLIAKKWTSFQGNNKLHISYQDYTLPPIIMVQW